VVEVLFRPIGTVSLTWLFFDIGSAMPEIVPVSWDVRSSANCGAILRLMVPYAALSLAAGPVNLQIVIRKLNSLFHSVAVANMYKSGPN
jgi:hypothetical protein